MKPDLILEALDFAAEAHKTQVRKYTGEPYIFHPIEVAQIVGTVTDNKEILAAALLHDIIEDTDVTFEDVRHSFGKRVADLVAEVTKVDGNSKYNRAIRKEMDRVHYSSGSPEGQTIKLADIIANASDVVQHDPSFAKVYIPEQTKLAESLTDGNKELYAIAIEVLEIASSQLV